MLPVETNGRVLFEGLLIEGARDSLGQQRSTIILGLQVWVFQHTGFMVCSQVQGKSMVDVVSGLPCFHAMSSSMHSRRGGGWKQRH